MNFYSIQFITFLLIALLCYYTVFRKKQWVCLLVASAVFYYWSGLGNFVFLFLTGGTTWLGAKYLGRYSEDIALLRKDKTIEKEVRNQRKAVIQKKRRVIMWSVLLLNFGVLASLKYFGLAGSNGVLGLVLPLGISFYTFQSIGYLLDIYNDKYAPEPNFWKYMLFVGYFP